SSKHVQTNFVQPNYDFISMFSGGLDSASFASECVRHNHNGILHHTITHDNPYGKAKDLYKKYFLNYGKFKLITTRGENRIDNPMYLRTRGLIFLTNIQCLASQLKIKNIIVPENGPFMINLGVSSNAEPTRTTNPQMLKDWTEIFNRLTNSNVQIKTPYIDLTKSEVIIRGGRSSLIDDTWSCSYFQGLSKMCGMCNSCFVRMLSCYAINHGEVLEKNYLKNPFTIVQTQLKQSNLNSYRISLDAIDFWFHIIHPDKSKNEFERVRFRTIRKRYPVMYKHSLDMFLGFLNLKNKYFSKEPIFRRFEKALKNVDSRELKNRADELLKQKKLVKWI
ncbi:MAG: 7-cyano-7-deazaguanine synthase, partial [Patescibacteria group bacterium]|nr:7-cyano-7-deazaguanine synthase [Patescibacteria group bacterium]